MNQSPEMSEPQATQPEDYASRAQPRRNAAWPRRTSYADDPRFKSPMLAALLSIVPGLGQVYVGYYRQGFINVLVVGSLIALLNIPNEGFRGVEPLLIFFLIFYWLYNLVDASRRASYYNQAVAGVAVIEVPQEFRMPERGGSFAGGLLMIAAGMVIASNTVFGYSLIWLERWWPAALILAGLYLVAQAVLERRREKKPE